MAKEFIFKDLDRESISVANPTKGDYFSNENINKFYKRNMGKIVMLAAGNQYTSLNITGPPGCTSGIYYPLCFWVRRQGFATEKADESIDVTPMHSAYYQLTSKQKEDLEAKIKSGIASAAQAVSDFELLSHDERKYKEFLRYFGYRTKKENAGKKKPEKEPDDYNELDIDEKEDAIRKRMDEHSLKAFFIDQVDAHTGDVALRNIVQRWPTLITDFMRISDSHLDTEKIRKDLQISKAEAIVLITKNKLFIEWKNMFLPEVKNRYLRIKQLLNSRKKSIEEYREWVKPYVAKHQLIKDALSGSNDRMNRSSSFFLSGGHAASATNVVLWLWKDFQPQEFYVPPGEASAYKKIDPYDKWTKDNLIWHPEHGLVASYPWITEKWIDERVKEIKKDWMNEFRHYYSFIILKFKKSNLRFPDGREIEDGIFEINTLLMSQNALLSKLLELKAKQYEFEKYINDILGVKSDFIEGEKYNPPREINLPFNMRFFKYGPYETTFYDRITRSYLIPMAATIYAPITNKIKDLMGYGKD